MEPIYTAALNIISYTQPSLDGGLLAYALNNIVQLPTAKQANVSFYSPKHTVRDHVLSTYARTGYAVAVTSGLLWIILLLTAAVFLCFQCRRKARRKTGMVYLADMTSGVMEANMPMLVMDAAPKRSSKPFYKRREQLQSHWSCLAVQFFLFCLLTVLLGTGVLLGFTVSSQLHASLASPPTHEEAIGRLLTSAELEHVDSSKSHVFPRLLRALAQVRAYLSEFVQNTKNHTAPVVEELIRATERMQDGMTNEFNALLFDKIGVSEAFAQGDLLGSSVISLITHSMAVVEQDTSVKAHFERFKIELQTWLRLINNYGPSLTDGNCTDQCHLLHDTFTGNLTARPDSFMPPFTFAIALKFVTTDRNQTAETVQAQLNQGKILADKQLTETKKIMAERINIPKSIGDMIDERWDMLGPQLGKAIQAIDQAALMVTRSVAPKVSSGSTIALAVGCIFWSLFLLLTVGITWLLIHYHCVPSKLNRHDRHRVRSVASCGLVLFAISMSFAVILFLSAGYAYSEVCRYLDPGQKMVTVVRHDTLKGTYTSETVFPLDSHINEFLNQHWPEIEAIALRAAPAGNKPMPLPHIRSPIYAVTHNCRQNMGVLQAFDAIRDFNMTSLNDPEMSARFVNIGREIMMDSLRSIDPNEMFPAETDEQLAMAGRLDDFIVNFEELRQNLPTTYVSVRGTEEDSVNYRPYPEKAMWDAWDAYRTIIYPSLTAEQVQKIEFATQQVRLGLTQMAANIKTIDGHLTDLSKAKKVGHVVVSLQANLAKLKSLMSDKPRLLEIAVKLFEENIAAKTPDEAAKLVVTYGPKLMAEVGRCRRLYEATRDVTESACGGVVTVMNGVWFVAGWITLVGTVISIFGLLLLLHKPDGMITRKFHFPTANATQPTGSVRGRRHKDTAPTTNDFSTQAEIGQFGAHTQNHVNSLQAAETGEPECGPHIG
ncbi:hypothetical protein CLF_100222 [Clonorchis sinensis]|uniref:Uncharacterized protein n=1 Tax=Clonorchis sinensis TaxID=79923 RepID=H2KNI2_CLOSI|nr:hypothetical protein CLF_100222 [Clonorchis sinensis]